MIKIRDAYFDASVEQVLNKIRQDTKGEFIRDIRCGPENIMITCPFHSEHNESHPSCGVISNEAREDCGVFHCFTCGQSGTLLDLIAFCFDNDMAYAIYWLQKNFAVSRIKEEQLLEEIILDNKETRNLLDESILNDFSYFHPYMFKRRLTEDIIRKFRIGCTPDGKYITFPCWNEHDELVGICKRSTTNKEFILPKDMPKNIYLLNFVLKEHITRVYVCEGQFDALIMWTYGYPAVALFGAGTTKTQMDILNKSGIREYILMYDNDMAGRHGAERFKKLIRKDVFVTDILMPKNRDCADCSKEEIDLILKNNIINS